MKVQEKDIKRKKFFDVLENVFLGKVKNIEGISATVKLMKIKSNYYQKVIKPVLEEEIREIIQKYPEFEEELYDKLYTFFSRYFTEGGAIAFAKTPFHNDVYDKIYTNERDVVLFWKTRDLYYIKTEKVFRSMEFDYRDYHFIFDASNVEGKRGNEKRSVIFTLKKVEGKTITFEVHYKEGNRETPVKDILRGLKNHGINLTEEDLEEVFKTYNRQTEVDFFIHKRPREFLKEQFNLWLYQYLSTDHEWPLERLNQFNLLRKVAFKLIDMIAQFEEEILKIWLKPRFVLNSNYVISLDRIAEKGGWHIIEKLQKHPGWQDQVREWIELGILEKEPDYLFEENLLEKKLKGEYQFLPIDTKYFKDLEPEILSLFDNLDEELDGWLIKSENFQALNTILPKFRGRVQTIYIDPPFNKEQDADYHYTVKFKDSTWATMLENRLKLAREFLKDTGAIFVRCDYNGNWIVKPIMDEIFGKGNFRNEIVISRGKRTESAKRAKFENDTETLFLYSKDADSMLLKIPLRRKENSEWTTMFFQGERGNPVRVFWGIEIRTPTGTHWQFSQERIDEEIRKGNIKIVCRVCKWEFQDRNPEIRIEGCERCSSKHFQAYYRRTEQPVNNNWTDIQSYVYTVSRSTGFPTENSEILLKRVIESTSDEGDLVMDFFLGSGTTCAVAHKLGRKWIGIEMGEHFYSVVLPRMKKVLYYDKSGISEEKDVKERYNKSNAGGFFKYMELEQFEDIFEKSEYSDVECSLFDANKKLLAYSELKENTIDFELDRLYSNVDLQETLSFVSGKPIKDINLVEEYYKRHILSLLYW